MATKLWHVPIRLATGALVLDPGRLQRKADEDKDKWLRDRAVRRLPPGRRAGAQGVRAALSAGEFALGTALLGVGLVPSGLAGLSLAVPAGP